jgi:hypothetical protein
VLISRRRGSEQERIDAVPRRPAIRRVKTTVIAVACAAAAAKSGKGAQSSAKNLDVPLGMKFARQGAALTPP